MNLGRRKSPQLALPPPVSQFRRPAEFGPLAIPLARIEYMRSVILEDQLVALAEGRHRKAPIWWPPIFVRHWMFHLAERAHIYELTGGRRSAIMELAWV